MSGDILKYMESFIITCIFFKCLNIFLNQVINKAYYIQFFFFLMCTTLCLEIKVIMLIQHSHNIILLKAECDKAMDVRLRM